jgi:cysteine desulfuration protein SufE
VSLPAYEEIAENLSVLDDWEDRYRYVIDLGKALPPLPDALRTEANRVQGCASQVWLATDIAAGTEPVLTFRGESDALIVRGLVALAITIASGRTAREIAAIDVIGKFDELGLKAHLSSQRSNGLRSMVARMRRDAEAALAGGSSPRPIAG